MPAVTPSRRYVQQRDGLRQLVKDMARPKTVAGRPYSGRQLAALLQQLVQALNSQEIPNVASMLEVFNRDLVTRWVGKGSMGALP